MNTPRWTDHDLLLAHEVGREYEHARLAELADELATAPPLAPPPAPAEQRIAERIADMIRSVGSTEYRGGPVPWQPGWEPGAGDAP